MMARKWKEFKGINTLILVGLMIFVGLAVMATIAMCVYTVEWYTIIWTGLNAMAKAQLLQLVKKLLLVAAIAFGSIFAGYQLVRKFDR